MSVTSRIRRIAVVAVAMAVTVGLPAAADANPSTAGHLVPTSTHVAPDLHGNGKGGSGVANPQYGGGYCGNYSGLKCVAWNDFLIPDGQSLSGYNNMLAVYHGYLEVLHYCSGYWNELVTYGDGSGSYVVMQSDGNLVLYNKSGGSVWSSGTSGHSSAFLAVQADGNVVIYNAPDPPNQNQYLTAIWATGTVGGC
jgi:hypothetical protein